MITAPSLDTAHNVSGIASIVSVIIRHNRAHEYEHVRIGKRDAEERGVRWLLGLVRLYATWCVMLLRARARLIHFNIALDRLALMRDVPLILSARVMRRRIVVHVHGGRLFPRLPETAWLRWVVRVVLTGRHQTIVLGEREAALFREAGGSANVTVLRNCVDQEHSAAFPRRFADGDVLTLLFMGRIAPGKGVDILCDAIALLRERGRAVRCVLAGTGPDEERYVSQLRGLLGDDFAFAGIVSGSEKVTLLQRCDVFVLPSEFEGLPMALLESMAFGLVPITTSVGSIGEVVTSGENGILLRERSAAELADAVEMLSSDPGMRERLSGNAQRYVREQHDPSTYVARLNEIYRHE